MRIAIIGGGISGLATYLQLQKHFSQHPSLKDKIDISIFESHDLKKHAYDIQKAGVPTIGGGYGLAANGMKSLRRLDPRIHDSILRRSFPTPRFQMKTRQGWTLGAIGCVIEHGAGGGPVETCCMVTREVVLEALYESLPDGIVSVRKVSEVVDGEEEVLVKFEDGEERTFDLVIGADGIWSRVRKVISTDKSEAPEYRELSTLGGFVEAKHLRNNVPKDGSLPHPLSQTIMTFGHNGFFSYTPCVTGDVSITRDHIRGKLAAPAGDMAFWWARSAHEDPTVQPDLEVARRDLEKRMQSWKDPNIRSILQHSLKTAMIPTYVLPRQQTWAGQRVLLVGDAAHALPTSSGQGVSQSLEDAEALAILLAHHLPSYLNEPESKKVPFAKVFDQYMTVRKAHVERILDAGNRGGDASRDMNVVAEYTMYAFFWVMLNFFSSFFTKELEAYDVVREVEKVVKT